MFKNTIIILTNKNIIYMLTKTTKIKIPFFSFKMVIGETIEQNNFLKHKHMPFHNTLLNQIILMYPINIKLQR